MKWWEYLILIAIFYVGYLISSFSIIGPSTCVNFAIPFSKKMQREGGVDTTRIIKANRMTVIIWFIINTAALVVLFLFVPLKYAVPYAAGCVLCYLFGVRKTRMNTSNLQDYYRSYKSLVQQNDIEAFENYISQYL